MTRSDMVAVLPEQRGPVTRMRGGVDAARMMVAAAVVVGDGEALTEDDAAAAAFWPMRPWMPVELLSTAL